jgi:hypothetical protein
MFLFPLVRLNELDRWVEECGRNGSSSFFAFHRLERKSRTIEKKSEGKMLNAHIRKHIILTEKYI